MLFRSPYDLLSDAGDAWNVRHYPFDAVLPSVFASAGTSASVSGAPVLYMDTGAAAGAQRVRFDAESNLAAPFSPWSRRLDVACAVYVPSSTYVSNAANEVGISFGRAWSSLVGRCGDGAAVMYNAAVLYAADGSTWKLRYTQDAATWETYTELNTGIAFALDTAFRLRMIYDPNQSLRARINGVEVAAETNGANVPLSAFAGTSYGFGAYVRCGAAAGARMRAGFLGAWVRGA